jgi:hypothetical protein
MWFHYEPKDAIDGRYVRLPVVFEGTRPIIRWMDEWNLEN